MKDVKKPRVGFIGCFQNGKSTLVNCFLENRIAASGEGVVKTRRVVRYVYGENPEFAFIKPDGLRRVVDQKTFFDETTRETPDGSVGEATICAPILREVDLIDTPGFDACQEDVETTTAEIPNFDFVFFVVGGIRGGLDEAERNVLQALRRFDKPFTILYNCTDLNAWSPDDTIVALRIRELESSLVNLGIEPRVVCGRRVFPVNLAWRWRAVVMKGIDENSSFFASTDAERRLERRISHYFDDVPTAELLNATSNFDWVYDYVAAPINTIGVVKNSIPTPILNVRLDERHALASWNFVDSNCFYEFAMRKVGARRWETCETHENEEEVEELNQGTEYEFRVRSISNDRRSVSPFCETVHIKTPPRRIGVKVAIGSGKRGLFEI